MTTWTSAQGPRLDAASTSRRRASTRRGSPPRCCSPTCSSCDRVRLYVDFDRPLGEATSSPPTARSSSGARAGEPTAVPHRREGVLQPALPGGRAGAHPPPRDRAAGRGRARARCPKDGPPRSTCAPARAASRVTLAAERPRPRVLATDLSADALRGGARERRARWARARGRRSLEGDLCAPLPAGRALRRGRLEPALRADRGARRPPARGAARAAPRARRRRRTGSTSSAGIVAGAPARLEPGGAARTGDARDATGERAAARCCARRGLRATRRGASSDLARPADRLAFGRSDGPRGTAALAPAATHRAEQHGQDRHRRAACRCAGEVDVSGAKNAALPILAARAARRGRARRPQRARPRGRAHHRKLLAHMGCEAERHAGRASDALRIRVPADGARPRRRTSW